MKAIGIMQPYFLPYIGYFQLINMVDEFVIYDNIEYTRKGWINRNRMLQNGKDEYFTLPLKKDSDYLHVNQRVLSDNFNKDKNRVLRKIEANYRKAPQFKTVFPIISEIFHCDSKNLFDYIYNSICSINSYLGINTKIIISSGLSVNTEEFKAQEKVLAICKELNAEKYINPIGGVELYDKEAFQEQGIELSFIESLPIEYKQFNNEFVPWLSILDVLMFNEKKKVQEYLNKYEIQS